MPGQLLHIFNRDLLPDQIGNGRNSKAMGREFDGQLSPSESPLHHTTHVVGLHGLACSPIAFLRGRSRAKEWGVLRSVAQSGCEHVGIDHLFKIVANGNLTALSALLAKTKSS